MAERFLGSCERGLVVVSIPKEWLSEIQVGHSKKTGRSALRYRDRAWEFWAEFDDFGKVYQRYQAISIEDFVEGGGTWEPYDVARMFGMSANRIVLE